MLAQINQWIELYLETTKSSPMLAAVSIPVVAAALYFLRSLPKSIFTVLQRTFTVTLYMNNTGVHLHDS